MGQLQNIPIGEDLLKEFRHWIQWNANPEDIFDKRVLEGWALENGFDKSDSNRKAKHIIVPVGEYRSYPFDKMKVGDSLFIEQKRSTFYYAVQWWVGSSRRGYGQKYRLKTEKNGTMCWRIE